MIAVHLHGSLGKEFGELHNLCGQTVHLLTRGLISRLGEKFKQVIKSGEWHIVLGKPKDDLSNCIEPEQVHQNLGKTTEVHIYPAVKGESSTLRIIVGAIMIAVAYFFPGPWSPTLYAMGASLIVGGIAEMLAPKPKTYQAASEDPNYYFTGSTNTNAQGVCWPVICGRARRAHTVIVSTGISVGERS